MGAKLVQICEEAKRIGGLKAQMRMAVLTKTPSSQAATVPDTPENVALFQNALNEIKKEN
ncbi:MAG: hypothetical protein GX121_02750 [Ignavibacteria bacterium]|jgi:hypothetical protein|nr:hypothetical protein [Ignavibacteria bacterium]